MGEPKPFYNLLSVPVRNAYHLNWLTHDDNEILLFSVQSRFFSNGQVLSLLTNDDFNPQQLIPLLKPTLRMKGLLTGAWRLTGTTVEIFNLIDASVKSTLPVVDADTASSRYTFQMTLTLRSRPLGRWNRLDLVAYESVEIASGEAVPVALKHKRPFWFSRVRSYV